MKDPNFIIINDNHFPVIQDRPVVIERNYPVKSGLGKPALIIDAIPQKDRLSDKFRRLVTRTTTIKWNDFFEIEKNEMVVYRIIPHSSVSNNTKRLWRSLYKMYEMYEKGGTRRERKGFKFTYREKDLFWYDVVFRQEKGEKKVEFYVSTSKFQAQKLKRKIENKMNVTIQEATLDDLQVPEEDTIVQELKYLKHDIFSMNTNTTEQKTPIAAVMNTLDELQFDGDFARLSICNEAENRQKWVKSASWAAEKMSKGKIPQRANINSKKVAMVGKTAIGSVLNEINSVITDTFQAFSNLFFKSDKDFNKEKVIKKAYSLEDEISSQVRSNASRDKVNHPVFKSRIRVAAHSRDRLTRDTISETLSLAFSEVAENNELHGVSIKFNGRRVEVIRELNNLKLSRKTKLDADVNLISTEEMAKLSLQLPTAELQRRYEEELSAKKQIETDIPAVMRKDGIHLGVAEFKDEEIDILMPVSDPDVFYRGYTFIGGQGSGKDTAIKNWVADGCLKYNISSVVVDAIVEEGERGMADGLRDALPPEKVIDIDLSDENYIVPMDLTEVIAKLGRKGASRFADEILDFFGDLTDKARTKRYLTAAAKASGGSLYNIKRIIEDEEFRVSRIEELLEEGNERLANDLIQWGNNEELGNKADPIINRLDDFFGNDTLFDIFAQPPKKEVDFAKWMKEGKVIIIRVPNRKLGSVATRTLVHWIALKTFMTRMLMTKAEQENGCFMVFNEPEQYATRGLSELMGRIATEGRKERFGSLYAFHHWNKLPQFLQEHLQGGGVQQFLFKNDHIKTFELSKHRFEDTIPLEAAYQLPQHHAIISVTADKKLQHAFICRMKLPLDKREDITLYDNSFLTKRHARMFGRSWQELQKAL